VKFAEELALMLPADVPHRDRLIEKADQHLRLVVAANEHMNLTRITDAREAAVKHVYDSVAPWRLFEHAHRVLDAGTGAGFPGIPLSIVLPATRFSLADSIQKKARFVDSTVESLELPNVHVYAERAEHIAVRQTVDIITARAVAPINRIIEVFAKPLKKGATLLLYKGPDVANEIAETASPKFEAHVIERYELPYGFGVRTVVQLRATRATAAPPVRAVAIHR
jgi:16S rRNA (guanine527-N7)-methyltransferase